MNLSRLHSCAAGLRQYASESSACHDELFDLKKGVVVTDSDSKSFEPPPQNEDAASTSNNFIELSEKTLLPSSVDLLLQKWMELRNAKEGKKNFRPLSRLHKCKVQKRIDTEKRTWAATAVHDDDIDENEALPGPLAKKAKIPTTTSSISSLTNIPPILANFTTEALFDHMDSFINQIFDESIRHSNNNFNNKKRSDDGGGDESIKNDRICRNPLKLIITIPKSIRNRKKMKSMEKSVLKKYLQRSPSKKQFGNKLRRRRHRSRRVTFALPDGETEQQPLPPTPGGSSPVQPDDDAEGERQNDERTRVCRLVLGGMRVRDYRQKGPGHPMCTPYYLRSIRLFKFRSRYVPIFDAAEESADIEWLQNLTAKLTKARRQNCFSTSQNFGKWLADSQSGRPRFDLEVRKPFRTFSTKYDEDGKKLLGASETDLPDYDGIFSMSKYREKANQLDNQFDYMSSIFDKIDDCLVFKANARHLFLFRYQSMYGDINNTKRDLYCCTVPRVDGRRTHGPLLRDLLEWSKKRGKVPSSYVAWDYCDPYQSIIDAAVETTSFDHDYGSPSDRRDDAANGGSDAATDWSSSPSIRSLAPPDRSLAPPPPWASSRAAADRLPSLDVSPVPDRVSGPEPEPCPVAATHQLPPSSMTNGSSYAAINQATAYYQKLDSQYHQQATPIFRNGATPTVHSIWPNYYGPDNGYFTPVRRGGGAARLPLASYAAYPPAASRFGYATPAAAYNWPAGAAAWSADGFYSNQTLYDVQKYQQQQQQQYNETVYNLDAYYGRPLYGDATITCCASGNVRDPRIARDATATCDAIAGGSGAGAAISVTVAESPPLPPDQPPPPPVRSPTYSPPDVPASCSSFLVNDFMQPLDVAMD